MPFHLQGHRGARGLKPENTLPSFEAALDCGVSSIETDLHLTADGIPVLCHDPQLPDGLEVASYQLAALQVIRLDRNPNPALFPLQDASITPLAGWYGEHRSMHPYALPTLADLFRFVECYAGQPGREAGKTDTQRAMASSLRFDLELKVVPFQSGGPESDIVSRFLHAVVAGIEAAGAATRTTVRSFDHRCVRRIRQLAPAVTGAVLVAETAFVDPGEVARRADATIYCPSWPFVDEQQVAMAHAVQVQVLPWTVNRDDQWQRLLQAGVDGITTDYPDRLAAFLRANDIAF